MVPFQFSTRFPGLRFSDQLSFTSFYYGPRVLFSIAPFTQDHDAAPSRCLCNAMIYSYYAYFCTSACLVSELKRRRILTTANESNVTNSISIVREGRYVLSSVPSVPKLPSTVYPVSGSEFQAFASVDQDQVQPFLRSSGPV